jgi:LmbE family N-acetylglucosaminyl deacetylase
VNVVSVMAHQDDELVCLGTMLKMQQRGDALHFICVTDGSGGMVHVPKMTREEAAATRDREMRRLADRLGASYTCLGERDEYLYDTAAVRDRLIAALRAAEADVVFTHFSPDYNVDHVTVNLLVRQCGLQAPLPLIPSEAPPLTASPAVFLVEPSGGFGFEPAQYVDITSVIGPKTELALCHESQEQAMRAALGKGIAEWMLESSAYRGSQAGVAHAEAFRPMLSRGFVKPYAILP